MKKKISTYAKENDLSYLTVYRMVKDNKLKHTVLPTGTILIIDEGVTCNTGPVRAALYARVSSSENKNNLASQLDRLTNYASAQGYNIVHSVKEVGSGLNDTRRHLAQLLNKTDYDVIIVEHKDRFSRFGINYIQSLLNQTGRRIEIINNTNENTKEDLMHDFISIITSFCARLYGLRRCRRRTEEIIKGLQCN